MTTFTTHIVDETTLSDAELEPSVEFARLLARTGPRIGLGSFCLGAIADLVRDRARTVR